MNPSDDQLVEAFAEAAIFLRNKCENSRWRWSSNFLREYVRCAYGYSFTNTRSPTILRLVKERYPELRSWIGTGTLKDE